MQASVRSDWNGALKKFMHKGGHSAFALIVVALEVALLEAVSAQFEILALQLR